MMIIENGIIYNPCIIWVNVEEKVEWTDAPRATNGNHLVSWTDENGNIVS